MPPDLIEAAYRIYGESADIATITDALFDAAFRALQRVPADNPTRWPMVTRYWEKMTALYEEVTGQASGEAGNGLVVVKRPPGSTNGRDHDPQPRNQPGLATPETYRPG